jgi:hypothetical protein
LTAICEYLTQSQFSDVFPEEKLPPCDQLTVEEIEQGIECSNETITEPRYNDPVFERLFAQLWEDYQISMNTQSSIYGINIQLHLR